MYHSYLELTILFSILISLDFQIKSDSIMMSLDATTTSDVNMIYPIII